jgi:hypothetical protein
MTSAGSGESFRDDQRVGFPRRLVDEGTGLRDPVVLEISPVPAHRVTTHRADMVVSAQRGAGQAFQNNAESA